MERREMSKNRRNISVNNNNDKIIIEVMQNLQKGYWNSLNGIQNHFMGLEETPN